MFMIYFKCRISPSIVQYLNVVVKTQILRQKKTQWYGDITSQIPRVPGSCHCLGRAQVYHLQVMVLMCMKITKATCVNNIRITC